jgi:Spy/CpxP family protein refolding chaperone
MLGFIIGTVCLIGLIKVLRRGRGWHGRWGYGGYGGGYGGYGGCGGHDHHGFAGPMGRGGFGGGPRRWFLRSIFERLETTPGQEKAILAALDELRENRRVVRDEAQQTRGDLARAVASGLVDDSTLEETFARHDRLLAQLRVSFVEALKKVTEVLDERQRKQVADMLEGGRFGDRIWA